MDVAGAAVICARQWDIFCPQWKECLNPDQVWCILDDARQYLFRGQLPRGG